MSSLAKGCVHFREAQNVGSILQSYKIVYRYLVKQIHQKEARDIKVLFWRATLPPFNDGLQLYISSVPLGLVL